MEIGILGSGDVAKALADGFIKYGHKVMLGTRTPASQAEWSARYPTAQLAGFADAASFGELIVLAVKGSAAAEVLQLAGTANISGKPVIDATNPIADVPPVNGVLKFYATLDESQMERLQREFSAAHFVKTFSCVRNAFMVDPEFKGGKHQTWARSRQPEPSIRYARSGAYPASCAMNLGACFQAAELTHNKF